MASKLRPVKLSDALRTVQDRALECGELELARELGDWALQLDGGGRVLWTPQSVHWKIFKRPWPVVPQGRASGRTNRMLSQAVADAANGCAVTIDPLFPPTGGHLIAAAEAMLSSLGDTVLGTIAECGRARARKIGPDRISACYADHYEGFSRR